MIIKIKELFRKTQLSPEENLFIMNAMNDIEAIHRNQIKKRQLKLKKLKISHDGFVAVWNGELPQGCKYCIEENSEAIGRVNKCNLECDFCYYDKASETDFKNFFQFMNNDFFSEDHLKAILTKAKKKAIFWVCREPFMDIEKHLNIIKHLNAIGTYQHLYTNGTLCTIKNLKKLGESGLNEIRFNLAATNCSDKCIDNIKIAKDFIPSVGVESPMTLDYWENFKKKRSSILDTGLDFINCAELHFPRPSIIESYRKMGSTYLSRIGYRSPYLSRNLTYDMMDLAEKESWDLTIHDCSNDTKFVRALSDDGVLKQSQLEIFSVDDYLEIIK